MRFPSPDPGAYNRRVRCVLNRPLLWLGGVAVALSLVSSAHALDGGRALLTSRDAAVDPPDAAPPPIPIKITIENLAHYPKHVFFLYPTTIGGFGVRFEAGKGFTKILRTKESGGSFLHVLPRTGYDRVAPKPRVRAVADEGANAEVFAPPFEAVRSTQSVAMPVPIDGVALRSVERVYVIKRVTDTAFDLELKTDDVVLADGSRVPMTAILADAAAHRPPPQPPKSAASAIPPPPNATGTGITSENDKKEKDKSGCSNSTAAPDSGLGVFALLAVVLLLRRRLEGPEAMSNPEVWGASGASMSTSREISAL
jgi:MYXO-CTERM domain-containing protein